MDQGGVILVDESEVERQLDEVERLGGWRGTNEEEEPQNEESGYERFPLTETSAIYIEALKGLPL